MNGKRRILNKSVGDEHHKVFSNRKTPFFQSGGIAALPFQAAYFLMISLWAVVP